MPSFSISPKYPTFIGGNNLDVERQGWALFSEDPHANCGKFVMVTYFVDKCELIFMVALCPRCGPE